MLYFRKTEKAGKTTAFFFSAGKCARKTSQKKKKIKRIRRGSRHSILKAMELPLNQSFSKCGKESPVSFQGVSEAKLFS